MQAQLNSVLGLRRTMSRDSIVSFPGSVNTKKAYKKFCKGLFNIGVTAELIAQKEKEIQDIFNTQHPAASSSQMDDSTSADANPALHPQLDLASHPQLPKVENSPDAPISSISTDNDPISRPRFGWARLPIDFLVGPSMLAAAEEGDAARLISTLGFIRNIDFQDRDWKKPTALHKAAAKGHKEIVQLLLSKGASLEAKDVFERTPLHYAALNGRFSTVELLLSKRASLEAKSIYGQTPLHCAAWRGDTSTVELLHSKGASLEAINKRGQTPLDIAIEYDRTDTIKLLKSRAAELGNI